tara:strand:+ start:6698 stop:7024 length:327 start_codon:yes stop_codon:yes gene_type:complete
MLTFFLVVLFIYCIFVKQNKTKQDMSQVAEDTKKLKDYVDTLIASLEKGDYVYVKDGYIGDNSGGMYDGLFQSHARKIVSKLLSLGYVHTTNHGFGCYDWKFYKEIDL